jgi:hypothetical protein
VVFIGVVSLAEKVGIAGAVMFCVGTVIILLPKFSMVVLLVRLTAYLPSDGEVSDHPVSNISTTEYSPGIRE